MKTIIYIYMKDTIFYFLFRFFFNVLTFSEYGKTLSKHIFRPIFYFLSKIKISIRKYFNFLWEKKIINSFFSFLYLFSLCLSFQALEIKHSLKTEDKPMTPMIYHSKLYLLAFDTNLSLWWLFTDVKEEEKCRVPSLNWEEQKHPMIPPITLHSNPLIRIEKNP